jgi:hypothetical protein
MRSHRGGLLQLHARRDLESVTPADLVSKSSRIMLGRPGRLSATLTGGTMPADGPSWLWRCDPGTRPVGWVDPGTSYHPTARIVPRCWRIRVLWPDWSLSCWIRMQHKLARKCHIQKRRICYRTMLFSVIYRNISFICGFVECHYNFVSHLSEYIAMLKKKSLTFSWDGSPATGFQKLFHFRPYI